VPSLVNFKLPSHTLANPPLSILKHYGMGGAWSLHTTMNPTLLMVSGSTHELFHKHIEWCIGKSGLICYTQLECIKR